MEELKKVGWDPRFYDGEIEKLQEFWKVIAIEDIDPDVIVHLGRLAFTYVFQSKNRPNIVLRIDTFDRDKAWEQLYFLLIESANVFLNRGVTNV